MLVTYLLSLGLALVAGAAPDETSAAQPRARTLLMVQPLYPGQEAVAQRAEQSINALLPPEAKASQIIGREALATWLEGRRLRTGCLLDKKECREPLGAWMQDLGLESVVLVKGGQDGSGFRFRAVRVRKAGERLEGEATDAVFEKALTGALVKVYSLAATVEIVSTPPGATLFLDGVRMGTTPVSTQVLPGEHTFRFELASYQSAEVSQVVGALARVKIEQVLRETQARLVISTRMPKRTRILVDGQERGWSSVDLLLPPGRHVLRLEGEDHEPYEKELTLAAGERFTLEKDLTPLPEPEEEFEPEAEEAAPPAPPVVKTPAAIETLNASTGEK